jgi:Protein of unknown function (DUF2735)
MTTTFPESAKIYAFPARGRFAANSRHEEFETVAALALPRGARLSASGSGWYHEEAIQDALKAEQSRKS